MNNNEYNNFEGIINQYAEASSKTSTMDIESSNNELHQMEKEIDYYKMKLQSCRDKYECVETEICNVRQLQHKALFVLNNVQWKEENLHERLKDIHLNYEKCVEKSAGVCEDIDERIRAKISELATERRKLMEELAQLKRNADDNRKKLVRANTMIAEQEQKNATLLRELKEKSENVTFIPRDIKRRIDTILKQLTVNDDDAIDDIMQ